MAALLRSGRPSRMCGEWWLCAHHTTCYCRARALPCLAAGSTMRAGMAFAFAPPTHFLTLHGPPASHAPVPHIAGRSITVIYQSLPGMRFKSAYSIIRAVVLLSTP